MREICTDLSPCGHAILALIVDSGNANSTALLKATYPQEHAWTIGVWTDWPRDVDAWFDELQTLLDRELVYRYQPKEHAEYLYAPTAHGVTVIRGALHGCAETTPETSPGSVA